MIGAKGDADTCDAGLIAAAQRVEHYEIAVYGTIRTYAESLGRNDFVDLLQRTLDEERRGGQEAHADRALDVNQTALRGHCSSVISRMGARGPWPALFTRTSTRPQRSMV